MTPDIAKKDSILTQLNPKDLNILLIRHGHAGPGRSRDIVGGYALTPLGLRQAQRIGKRLSTLPIDHLYSSDLARAQETAQAVASFHPQTPWDVLSDLRETSSFTQAIKTIARTKAERDRVKDDHRRAGSFITRLRKNHRQGQLVAVVAHGHINRLLIAYFGGFDPRNNIYSTSCHTSISAVSISKDGESRLLFLNCTRHLPVSMITEANATATHLP